MTKIVTDLLSILVIVCSAGFASMYARGNVELSWTRSVDVFDVMISLTFEGSINWRYFKNLMAEGNHCFSKVLALYVLVGGVIVVVRVLLTGIYIIAF